MREQLAKKSKEMEMVKMQKSKPRNKKLQNQQTKKTNNQRRRTGV